MANVVRTRLEDGSGTVGAVPTLQLDKKGNVSVSLFNTVISILASLANAINGRLSLGSGVTGFRSGNIDGQWIDLLTPAVADTEFIVPHGLGRVPVGVWPMLQDADGFLKASSTGSWDETVLYLKCSGSSVTMKIIVV